MESHLGRTMRATVLCFERDSLIHATLSPAASGLIRLLRPSTVDFADMLDPAHGANFPSDIVWDRDDP